MHRGWLILLLSMLVLGIGLLGYGQGGRFANVAALLQIGAGARPLGMGGAFVGLADDENAAFYNPAALAFLENTGFTSLYSRQFQALDYSVIGLAGRFAGINLLQLYSGEIEGANEFGNPDGSLFSYISRAGIISLGLGIGRVGIGTRLKLYQELSDGVSGLGWALDPAVMIIRDNLRLGVLLENGLSGGIRFDNGHVEGWNPDLRIGSSLSLKLTEEATVNLLLDLSGLLGGVPQGHLGVELWVEGLGVRAGLDGGAITVGSSVWMKSLRIDWAYAAHPRLPDTNRVSLTLRF
ncbi:MAG: hypothetical protein ACE5KR_02110 [Candidatus Bipolaricaulia bacterium]